MFAFFEKDGNDNYHILYEYLNYPVFVCNLLQTFFKILIRALLLMKHASCVRNSNPSIYDEFIYFKKVITVFFYYFQIHSKEKRPKKLKHTYAV